MASSLKLTADQKNFWILCILNFQIAPKAVRVCFDKFFNPTNLAHCLNSKKIKINDLIKNNIITQCQKNLLEQVPGVCLTSSVTPTGSRGTTSQDFDITLMICLLRNLSGIRPPSKGWNDHPPKSEASDSANLVRIKYHRNEIAHASSTSLSDTEFQERWKCVGDAIYSLSSGKYTKEVQDLLQLDLDGTLCRQQMEQTILELESVKEELEKSEEEIERIKTELEKYEQNAEFHLSRQQGTANSTQPGTLVVTEEETEPVAVPVTTCKREALGEKVIDDTVDSPLETKPKLITKAVVRAIEILKQNNCVVILGQSGSGKSTVVDIVKSVIQGYEFVDIKSVDDLHKIKDSLGFFLRTLIIVDESIDNYRFNQYILDQWMKSEPDIFKKGMVKLMCTITAQPTINCPEHNIIDLDNEIHLMTSGMKTKILTDALNIEGVEINEDETKSISDIKSSRFMFCCSIFTKNDFFFTHKYRFFKHPVTMLKEYLTELQSKDRKLYFALVVRMMFSQVTCDTTILTDCFDENIEKFQQICNDCSIESSCSSGAALVVDKLKSVVDIFVNHKLEFKNIFLYETVGCHFGTKHTETMIKWCCSDFIRQNVCLVDHELSDMDKENAVYVDKSFHVILARRIVKEFINGNFYDVLHSQPVSIREFVVVLATTLFQILQDKTDLLEIRNSQHHFEWFLEKTCFEIKAVKNPMAFLFDKKSLKLDDFFYSLDIKVTNNYKSSHLFQWLAQTKLSYLFKQLWSKTKYSLQRQICKDTKLLISAIEGGCLDIMKSVYISHPDSQTLKVDRSGNGLFCEATFNNKFETVTFMIDNNISNVNIPTKKRRLFPSHISVLMNNEKILQCLLQHGAHANQMDNLKRTPLFIAIMNENVNIAQILIKHSSTSCINNSTDKKIGSTTALHEAVKKQNSALMKLLVTNKAKVNLQDNLKCTPLMLAIRNEDSQFTEYLVSKQADTNICDKDGTYPLHYAVRTANMGLVQVLLENGALINVKDNKSTSPLLSAVQMNNDQIVEQLLNHNADVNLCSTKGTYPIHASIEAKNISTFSELLKHGANINVCCKKGMTPLILAALHDISEIASIAIDNGANINHQTTSGKTALHFAVSNKNVDIVSKIITRNANVTLSDENGISPIILALRMQNDTLTDLVVNDGRDIGWTAFHFAVKERDLLCLTDLIEKMKGKRLFDKSGRHCSDINVHDKSGLTPLHIACICNEDTAVKLILENGGHIYSRDVHGRSPLHFTHGEDVLKLLVEEPIPRLKNQVARWSSSGNHSDTIEINMQETSDEDRLHHTTKQCLKIIFAELLGYHIFNVKRSVLNKSDNKGNTPLHYAVKQAHYTNSNETNVSFCKRLIEYGSDVRLRNKQGQLPYQSGNPPAMADVLKRFLRFEKKFFCTFILLFFYLAIAILVGSIFIFPIDTDTLEYKGQDLNTSIFNVSGIINVTTATTNTRNVSFNRTSSLHDNNSYSTSGGQDVCNVFVWICGLSINSCLVDYIFRTMFIITSEANTYTSEYQSPVRKRIYQVSRFFFSVILVSTYLGSSCLSFLVVYYGEEFIALTYILLFKCALRVVELALSRIVDALSDNVMEWRNGITYLISTIDASCSIVLCLISFFSIKYLLLSKRNFHLPKLIACYTMISIALILLIVLIRCFVLMKRRSNRHLKKAAWTIIISILVLVFAFAFSGR